jgi:chromosome segregation ATPase
MPIPNEAVMIAEPHSPSNIGSEWYPVTKNTQNLVLTGPIGKESSAMADARAARCLNREINRHGVVETADAGTHWQSLLAETATIRQYKDEISRLEKRMARMKKTIERYDAFIEDQQTQLQTLVDAVQVKDQENVRLQEELDGLKVTLHETQADFSREFKEKLKYWDELSRTMRMVDILEHAVATGDHSEVGSHGQDYHLCPPLV